ncbi:hypothetical protein N7326_02430 [Corynebacterium sp. ES2794-CONJ1]|uniref:hypothetical protein n=1 Tax=unclassified Corynebacterium TaxID=2624378 RepID=UPI00216ABBD0|nr:MULTISPECIES: hypothetical protein [unclassified Corynebacterium]MCS4531342.1 hypothetical protein [Corynebacterium sp. ES2730-CONJ]MCU9518730.1 hypothetical protein [Corynebacterium sp. ES2794-CONJ1]
MNDERIETVEILVKEPDDTPLVRFVLAASGEECVQLIGIDPSVSPRHWLAQDEEGRYINRALCWVPGSDVPHPPYGHIWGECWMHPDDARYPRDVGKYGEGMLGYEGLEKLKRSSPLRDGDYLCDFNLGCHDSFKVRVSKLAPVLVKLRRAGITEIDSRTLRQACERAAMC